MLITLQPKTDTVVTIPVVATTVIASAQANALSLGQLKSVDISQAQPSDVLMFDGTKWQAESLDGGEFN